MRWTVIKIYCLCVGLLAGLGACKNDRTETKLTYMPDMADNPTVKPQQDYLEPPDGSMAVNALIYPPDDQIERWEEVFINPYHRVGSQERAEAKLRGKELYHANCSTCHGPGGKGDGTISDKFPMPPDLTDEIYADRSDGYFFHKITVGGPIMPSRAEATSPLERWEIILHVRSFHSDNQIKGMHP